MLVAMEGGYTTAIDTDTILLVGQTSGGNLALLVREATWTTIGSVADGLSAASALPITWSAHVVKATNIHDALIEIGLGDQPMANLEVAS